MSESETPGAGAVRGSFSATVLGFASRHALLLIVALGAAVRFGTLGTQDLWLDEIVTVEVIRQGPIDLLRAVQAGESNPATYYLLAGGFERVFGDGEVGLRLLPALAGIATIPVVYATAKALASRRAALIAAALTATSPLLVWYSTELRNYSLLVFLAALATLFFVRALEDRAGQRWLWGWALFSALALTTHYFAFALIVPQAVWLLLRRPGPRFDTGLAIGAIGAVGFALLPLLAVQRGRGGWIDEYSLFDRLVQVPEHFLVGLWTPWDVLPALVVAVAAAVAVYAAVRADSRLRRAILIPASVALGGAAFLLLAGAAGDDYILTRNLLELWAPFAVALAVALGAEAVGRLGTLTAVALCAVGLGLAVWTAVTPEAQRPSYSELATDIGPADQERLIVSQTSFSAPLLYYLGGTRPAADEDLSTSELIVVEPRPTEDYSVGICWWIATCGNVDVEPPPPFEPPPGFRLERTESAGDFDYDVYTAPRPIAIQRPLEYYTPRVFLQSPP